MNSLIIRFAQLLPAHLAGKNVVAMSFFDNRGTVDHDGFHSRGMSLYFLGVDNVRQLLAH
jgi:hypothetical protein